MPDNPIPAAQPGPDAEPTEFNFDKTAENPRIKRRNLKAKPAAPAKPTGEAMSTPRDPDLEAPAWSASPAKPSQTAKAASAEPVADTPQTPAPAKHIPVVVKASDATNATSRTSTGAHSAAGTTATRPGTTSGTTAASSPHGTRPATLYYSSSQRKEQLSPMKSNPAASSASHATSANSTAHPTTGHPAPSNASAASAASRPTTVRSSIGADYRANVERQSREQKSVGNLLAYVVYGFIFVFFVSVGLATYGAVTIFNRLHDQSVTVADLDSRYTEANKELNAKLLVTQDTLSQAQAEIARQQDLIVKQQEELNRLIASLNDETNAMKSEKATRSSETAALRARVRDLENREANRELNR